MQFNENKVETPLIFSIKEAATAARVSCVTMYRWVKLPDFPAIRSGRKWLIPVEPFRGWIIDKAGKQLF